MRCPKDADVYVFKPASERTLRVGPKGPYLPLAKMHVWLLLGGKSDNRTNVKAVAASERWQNPSGVSDQTCLVSSRLVLRKLDEGRGYLL